MMTSDNEKDDIPMLPISDSSFHSKDFTSRTRSVSLSNPTSSIDGFDNSTMVLGYTGPLRTQGLPPLVQMSGPLTSTRKPEPLFFSHPSTSSSDSVGVSSQLERCPSALDYDSARDWDRRLASYVIAYLAIIVNPHGKHFKRWSQFFALSCLLAIYIDPLFFFLVKVHERNKCMMIDWPMTRAFVAVRSVTDVIFTMNILLQFRLAYVAPESAVVGAGQLVSHPKKIALHYFRGNFFLDLFIVMPFPQIMILCIIPPIVGSSGEVLAKHFLRAAVLLQYIPKLYRLIPFIAGQVTTGFMFATTWSNFVTNLLTFMLAGHVVGSCWYLFGLQRVKRCMVNVWNISGDERRNLIDCARGSYASESQRALWRDNASVIACFQEDGFPYGIYIKAVNLTYQSSILTRYTYSLFWGFQQIITFAGNQAPSYFLDEVLFTMSIIVLGLFLFGLLIGNMQNFLQVLGKRKMEMKQRIGDVENWMSRRRLPQSIRKRVREAERFNWDVSRGFNEELHLENMPDDLQRDIRRHLFAFLRKVSIFSALDESIMDAIAERLKQRTYVESTVLHSGGPVEKMVFIVRGEVQSTGEDGCRRLSEGDVCGEELFNWCLKRSYVNPGGTRINTQPKRLVCNSVVTCITNVVAFWLSVADLEDVTSLLVSSLMEP